MSDELRLAVIGAGNMGQAVIRGVIAAGLLQPRQIIIYEPEEAKLKVVAALGCRAGSLLSSAAEAGHVLLAIKPQQFPAVVAGLGRLTQPAIVISVMAGLGTDRVRAALGDHARVVRVMPNMAAQLRAGTAAVALGAGAQPGDERFVLEIFNALGTAVVVEEPLMNAVTAVSGSGPAYVFLLAEAMEQAAIKLGLPQATARALVAQTIAGAGHLLQQPGADPAALRQAVTSKGGTTEAALRVMLDRKLPEIIVQALTAARDRGIELNREA